MKYLITLALSLLALVCMSQNSVPQIEIIEIENDQITETLTVTYSLSDADDDICEVWLKTSEDDGIYFEMEPLDNLTGDIGENIAPSATRTLFWDYSELTGGIEALKIRLFASDHQIVDIAEMVIQVDEAELLSTLEAIIGERHYYTSPTKLAEVRTFITNAFTEANLQTEAHDFEYDNTTMQNIIGRKPGVKEEDITYIIDGHFDTVVGTPGADDSGSAVVGMLEALRILSQYSFEHSIRFIGFDAEEPGLVGSYYYVRNGIKPFEDIQGVFNLEMIGFYSDEPNSQQLTPGFDILFPEATQQIVDDENRGNFILGIGNTASNSLLASYISASENYVPELRLITLAVEGVGEIAPDLRRSDHARFWDGGIQALFIVDGGDSRNPYYHTANDDISTLNFEFIKNVVKSTLATVAELAKPMSVEFDEVDLSILLSSGETYQQFPEGINIFPNPSNEIFTLQKTGNIDLLNATIYDINGRVVKTIDLKNMSSSRTIDLSSVATGMYFMAIKTNTSKHVVKLLKK